MVKRILIFSLAYYPDLVGGAEVALKEITDRLDPVEFEFHMITTRYNSRLPKVEKIGNILVHRIGIWGRPHPTIQEVGGFPLSLNKYYFEVAAAFKAYVLDKQYRYSAQWAMLAQACAIPGGIFKTLRPSVPYILTLQDGHPPLFIERQMFPVWPLFKRGFLRADRITALSTFLSTWARRMGYRGPLEIIPNGADTRRFSEAHSPSALERVKAELGKKMGDVFLVTTSRLVHKNAVDDVIRALPLLPENVSFIVYGIGPDESALKSLVKNLGVEKRVQFRGEIVHDEMPLALKASDIFIRPSRSEGQGTSFMEAMAAGLPVIATQEGGIADFLFDEKRNPDKPPTGFAVDKDSPEQIAAVVKSIMEKPERAAAVAATARAMVLEKYDWNLIAEKMRRLFREMEGV